MSGVKGANAGENVRVMYMEKLKHDCIKFGNL